MLSYEEIRKDPQIQIYIERADEVLENLGYTEHSLAHVCKVARAAAWILETLGFSDRECELAQIAGYMHDIGNVINRTDHAQSGAVMAFRLLDHMGADAGEITTIISAIGNHDESTAVAVNPVAAALILADKTDVRRSRVRNRDLATFDIHDRVNYAVDKASIHISPTHDVFTLDIHIDTSMSSLMDYFEIFLERMLLCRKACERLSMRFSLVINEQTIL